MKGVTPSEIDPFAGRLILCPRHQDAFTQEPTEDFLWTTKKFIRNAQQAQVCGGRREANLM